MKSVYIVCAIALFAAWHLATSPKISEETEEQFQNFVATYRKSYASQEAYGFRLGVFNENLKEIERLTILNPSAEFKINEFADMTREERDSLLGYKGPKPTGQPRRGGLRSSFPEGIPQEVDFSSKMTDVKNQGSCGSCWAFAAVEQLEYGYANSNKIDPQDFSPQQFVDCTRGNDYGSEGCEGGWMDDVFDYVQTHKVCTEAEYPYKGRDLKCHDTDCKIDLRVTDIK